MKNLGRVTPIVVGTLAAFGLLVAIQCGSQPSVEGLAPGPFGTGGHGVQAGPCTTGATAACHVETGRDGNVVNCFSGKQTCTNGQWGPCGGTSGTLSTLVFQGGLASPSGAGGLRLQSVTTSDASALSAGCVNNPCDPYCIGIDVDAGAGLTTEGGATAGSGMTVLGTISAFSSFPSAKCSAMAGASGCAISSGCQVYYPAPNGNECNYDYCCSHEAGAPDGAVGTCVQWIDKDASGACTAPASANQIDYTMGVGCTDSSGNEHFPICNRGTADATSGKLLLYGYSSNPNNIASSGTNTCSLPSSGAYSAGCIINLATAPIPKGQCLDINMGSPAAGITCDGNTLGSGNRSAMINPPNVSISTSSLQTAYGATTYTQAAEADKCNNYTFVLNSLGNCASYGGSAPPPATFKYSYTANCPSGTAPRWNQLAYQSSEPTQSDALFVATTQSVFDGGVGDAGAPVTLADPGAVGGSDCQVCLISGAASGCPPTTDAGVGPNTCPRPLSTLLGSGASNAILNLTITLTDVSSATPPAVTSWSVTYDCVPSE